jgi:thiol-disulfide isomerase/thioredoxin
VSFALLVVASALAGCGDDGETVPPPSRVIAVPADPNAGPNVEEFCDVQGSGGDAPTMSFPELAGDAPPPASGTRWINVWATWCAPCVEEIPRLLRFQEELEQEGAPVDLVFLSADRDDEAVAAFREEHETTPEGPRIADPTTLPAWVQSVGLDEGATLPIHIFVDDESKVTCARTGGVSDEHFEIVKTLASR